MRRRFGTTVSLGVAGAVLASAFVAAQTTTVEVPKPAARPANESGPSAPRGKVEVETRVERMIAVPAAPAPPAPPALMHVIIAPDRVAQLTQQFRSYLRVEYHFLRTIGSPTPEQRKRLAQDAERALKDAVARYDEMQRSPQLRRVAQPPRELLDPRKLILQGLARAAEEHLSPEQAARYREEIAKRDEDLKRVAIEDIVTKLDQQLILSAAQRARIIEALASGWEDQWFPTEYMLLNAERYLSRIPAQRIAPLLEADQRRVWESATQNPTTSGITVSNSLLSENFPEDEELVEARETAARDAEVMP